MIKTIIDLYEVEGKVMRVAGRFAGREKGIILVTQWAGISALFIPWGLFKSLVEVNAFKLERMSPAAGGGLHLRPNKLPLKQALAAHQGEFVEVKLTDQTSAEWKADWDEWRAGRSKAAYNLGWYAEYRLHEAFGLEWNMTRNRRTKGQPDIRLPNGECWEVKDLVGAGFQIRPEQMKDLGIE